MNSFVVEPGTNIWSPFLEYKLVLLAGSYTSTPQLEWRTGS
jgi:hypothetical protein